MEIKTLYKYRRKSGGVTVSPEMPGPGVEYTEMYRVIASEGMLATQDGINKYPAIDTDTNLDWYEVEDDIKESYGAEDDIKEN